MGVSESEVLGASGGFRRFRRRNFPFVVVFSEPGADEARLLRQRLAAKRLGFLLTVFHDDTCPALASHTPRRHACATPACPRLAVLRTLDRAADVVAVGVTRRGDCVVTVWCPACGKRHVHRWPWDSVEPGARRPHRRFLSPNGYRIPRPARKLLAHFDAGPWSPATSNAAQEPATPGRG